MRAIEFLSEQQLDEVAMNPTRLRQMAAQTGAIAGIEFEMIVPNAESGDEGESEPDYNSDDRVSDLDSIQEFFEGDYNSRRDVQRFVDALQSDYYDWANEARWEQWGDEGRDFFDEYVEDYFDEESALETAGEEIADANPELPTDGEEFQNLVEARVEELKQEWLDEEWEDQGRLYDRARESWEEDAEYPDEDDWFRREGYRYMSDLPYGQHGIMWPYWTGGSNGGRPIGEIAEDFETMIGRPVEASESYHGATRKENTYVIEPDSSLKPEDYSDAGLEFVSPPLPLDEMLSDFNKVVQWAKSERCYTNDSTGLHMNVSVPNFSQENLDYVKLALLLGDRYVLEQFNRVGNTYTKSAMAEVLSRIKYRPEDAQSLLKQMRSGLNAQAAKIIHSGATNKYTSINTHDGYIEFRSPGGDWLDEDWGKLEATLLRFVVALDAACDPQKYRQEYLKKLYAVLQPKSEQDPIAMFAKYSAGQISKPELQTFIKQIQTQRNVAKAPVPPTEQPAAQPVGQWGRWTIIGGDGNAIGVVSGRDVNSARAAAMDALHQRWPDRDLSNFAFRVQPEQR